MPKEHKNTPIKPSILKTSDIYRSEVKAKAKTSDNAERHCAFDDAALKIIEVDNWKEYNYLSNSEPDDCSCNCSIF